MVDPRRRSSDDICRNCIDKFVWDGLGQSKPSRDQWLGSFRNSIYIFIMMMMTVQ